MGCHLIEQVTPKMDIPQEQRLDPRRRELHPEQIIVGDEIFVRNDKIAESHGVSERTVNRGDRDGAPYRFFGGVKYRPKGRYDQFILDSIREDKPQAAKRGRKRA
jgi:hypothetical protein